MAMNNQNNIGICKNDYTAKLIYLLLMAMPLIACSEEWHFVPYPYYTAAPIDARIVDDATNQPIEGVNVTANWQLVTGSFDGPRDKAQLELMEAVTDKNGHFHFDGFTRVNPLLYELRSEDPLIIIFKGGYEYKRIVNSYPRESLEKPGTSEWPDNHRRSWINGGTIKLKKLKGLAVGDKMLFYTNLEVAIDKPYLDDCGWKKVPRMIVAMDRERRRLEAIYPNSWVDLLSIETITLNENQYRCGSPKDFFKPYGEDLIKSRITVIGVPNSPAISGSSGGAKPVTNDGATKPSAN